MTGLQIAQFSVSLFGTLITVIAAIVSVRVANARSDERMNGLVALINERHANHAEKIDANARRVERIEGDFYTTSGRIKV